MRVCIKELWQLTIYTMCSCAVYPLAYTITPQSFTSPTVSRGRNIEAFLTLFAVRTKT